jgi:hypothetical protein
MPVAFFGLGALGATAGAALWAFVCLRRCTFSSAGKAHDGKAQAKAQTAGSASSRRKPLAAADSAAGTSCSSTRPGSVTKAKATGGVELPSVQWVLD